MKWVQEEGTIAMTQIQSLLYAAALFLALTSLLKWKYRREIKTVRMQRSLRLYSLRVLTELSGGIANGLSGANLGTAC